MYFIGFNVPKNGSMEDPVEDYILEKKLDNDRNLWEDECWGNLPPPIIQSCSTTKSICDFSLSLFTVGNINLTSNNKY